MLTHDAKPTGSTHSSPLLLLVNVPADESLSQTAHRRLLDPQIVLAAASSDSASRDSRTLRRLQSPSALGSGQQKRPDCRRTVTTPAACLRQDVATLASSVPAAYSIA